MCVYEWVDRFIDRWMDRYKHASMCTCMYIFTLFENRYCIGQSIYIHLHTWYVYMYYTVIVYTFMLDADRPRQTQPFTTDLCRKYHSECLSPLWYPLVSSHQRHLNGMMWQTAACPRSYSGIAIKLGASEIISSYSPWLHGKHAGILKGTIH